MGGHAVGETHALVQPRTAPARPRFFFDELPADAPAAVAAFHGVHPTRGIAAVGIIVAGEEVAKLIKRQLLRIAQAHVEKLQLRAVGIAAIDRARLRRVQSPAFFGDDGGGAVAVAEVEFAIGPHAQSVQVVPQKSHAYPEALRQRLARLGHAVAVFVLQQPEIGDVGQPHLAAVREHAGGQSVHVIIEAVGKNRGVIGAPIAIAILHQAHAVAVIVEPFDLMLFVKRAQVVHTLRGQLGVQPVHVAADIRDASVQAKRFHHKKSAQLINVERHGIGQMRLGGEQIHAQPFGHLKTFDGQLGLLAGGGHGDGLWRGQRRCALQHAAQSRRCKCSAPFPNTIRRHKAAESKSSDGAGKD